MDLEEIGINAGNWIDSAQDRDCVIEPPGSISHGVSYLVNREISLGRTRSRTYNFRSQKITTLSLNQT